MQDVCRTHAGFSVDETRELLSCHIALFATFGTAIIMIQKMDSSLCHRRCKLVAAGIASCSDGLAALSIRGSSGDSLFLAITLNISRDDHLADASRCQCPDPRFSHQIVKTSRL